MPPRSPRILLVDDEPGIRLTLGAVLSLKGYEVETAVDGMDAIERFTARRPDLVISDLRMPRMDGFELLRKIRELSTKIGLIAITGEFPDKPAGLVADAFFTKGAYRPEELLAEVRRLLEVQRPAAAPA